MQRLAQSVILNGVKFHSRCNCFFFSTGSARCMPPSERSLARRERKDNEKIASLSNPSVNTKSHADTPDVSSLSPKPCYTCGREISPRAKWARNWDAIKYCSDHCKGWKSTVRVGAIEANWEDGITTLSPRSEILKSCLAVQDDCLLLHLDAWIEQTIFELIGAGKRKGTGGPVALQQISDHMNMELTNPESIPPFCLAIKEKVLKENPGLREIIRRAARRLVILDSKDWPSTQLFGPKHIHIELSTQEKGKHILRTLQDVSFAKGEMYIRRVTT